MGFLAEDIDDLPLRDNFELSNQGKEIDDGEVRPLPLRATVRALALLAGEGIGYVDVGCEQILGLHKLIMRCSSAGRWCGC